MLATRESDDAANQEPTHIDTTRKGIWGKGHLEAELVDALLKPAITAEDDLILEQSREAISEVFRTPPSATWAEIPNLRGGFPSRDGILKDLDETVQTDNEMCNADGTHDGQDDGALDDIAGEVCAPGIVGFDVEVGDVAIAVGEMGAETGQERGGAISGTGVEGHDIHESGRQVGEQGRRVGGRVGARGRVREGQSRNSWSGGEDI